MSGQSTNAARALTVIDRFSMFDPPQVRVDDHALALKAHPIKKLIKKNGLSV